MLNGKELVSQAGSLKTKLLAVGTKLVEPLLESNAHLKEVEDNFKKVTSVEKINRSDSRSIGKYESNASRIRILKVTGKTHRLVGNTIKGVFYLEPHEALFLMETNELIVYFDEVIVSIEQAYHLFLNTPEGITSEKYFAYSHLMKTGFAVRRYQKNRVYKVKELSEKDEILVNLKKNLHFINQRDVRKYEVNEKVQQSFLDIRASFLEGSSDNVKRQKLDLPITLQSQNIDDFPESNPTDEFYDVFQQLNIIKTVQVEEVEVDFDFDLYPVEANVSLSKELPQYYAKVLKYSEKVDNRMVKALLATAKGVKVLFVIVFENLSVACYSCE